MRGMRLGDEMEGTGMTRRGRTERGRAERKSETASRHSAGGAGRGTAGEPYPTRRQCASYQLSRIRWSDRFLNATTRTRASGCPCLVPPLRPPLRPPVCPTPPGSVSPAPRPPPASLPSGATLLWPAYLPPLPPRPHLVTP